MQTSVRMERGLLPDIGCLLIPQFPLACELSQRPELQGRPLVVAGEAGAVVMASSPEAQRAGVWPGQPLGHATSLCPQLSVIDATPALYREIGERIIKSLYQIIPNIEPHFEGPDGFVYLHLAGMERHYPTLESIASALLSTTPSALRPQLGFSVCKFPALVAASRAQPMHGINTGTQSLPSFLAKQPIHLLPVSQELLNRFRLLGIDTLGAITTFPKAAFAAEFGREGTHAWLLAHGDDPEPFRPLVRTETIDDRLTAEAAIATRQELFVAIEHLLRRICRSRQFRGRSVRQIQLRLITDRGEEREKTITTKEALSDANEIWRFLASNLQSIQTPGPVAEIELRFAHLAQTAGWQKTLNIGNGLRNEYLQEGLRKLQVQYGRSPVAQIVPMEPDSRIPENRWALIDRNP